MCDLILPPRLREIEERLHGLKASSVTQTPALKFKVREGTSFSLSRYFLNSGVRTPDKWKFSREWLRTVCLDAAAALRNSVGNMVLQPQTVTVCRAVMHWRGGGGELSRMNTCSLPQFTFGQVRREKEREERKSWGRCVKCWLFRSNQTWSAPRRKRKETAWPGFRQESWPLPFMKSPQKPKAKLPGSVWLELSGLGKGLGEKGNCHLLERGRVKLVFRLIKLRSRNA